MMKSKIAALTIVLSVNGLCVSTSRADERQRFWNWLVEQANEAPFEEMPNHRAIYALLKIAESCEAMQRRELADHFLRRAETIVEKSGTPHYYSRLFQYAAELKRMELAERYVNKAGRTDRFLDRLDLVRFRAGDKDAIKNYPRAESDFYNAMGLADAYIETGDFKAVEEFVSDLKISEENDPRDVAGIAFKRIAKALWKSGKRDSAERLVELVCRASKKEAKQHEDRQQKLANVFAVMGRQTELQEIFRRSETPDILGFCILSAVTGYPESLEKK